MIIAIDIDGITANTNDEIIYRYGEAGVDATGEQNSFKWEDCFGEPYPGWIGDQLKDPTFWLNAKPYADAWYMINKWFNDLHDIYFVTARWEEEVTLRWLDEWDIPYNGIITNVKTAKKYKEVLKLGASIMIEDRPEEVYALAKNEIVTFVVDRPYNKEIMEDQFIFTVDSFYDIDNALFGGKDA